MMAYLLVDCMAAAFDRSQAEKDELADEIYGLKCSCSAIKEHYATSRHTLATMIHLEDMPCELQNWLLV